MILINQRGCEPHSFYIPIIRSICSEKELPFLALNIEHTELNFERVKSQRND